MDYERFHALTNTHLFILGFANMHKPGDQHNVEECIAFGRQLVENEIDTYYDTVNVKRYKNITNEDYIYIISNITKHGDHTDVFRNILDIVNRIEEPTNDPNYKAPKVPDKYKEVIEYAQHSMSWDFRAIEEMAAIDLCQYQYIQGIDYVALYDAKEKALYPEDFKQDKEITYIPLPIEYEYNFSIAYTLFVLLVLNLATFKVLATGGGIVSMASGGLSGIGSGPNPFAFPAIVIFVRFLQMVSFKNRWDYFAKDWCKNYDWKAYREAGYAYDCSFLSLRFGGTLNSEITTTKRPYPLFNSGRLKATGYFLKETIGLLMIGYLASTLYTMFF